MGFNVMRKFNVDAHKKMILNWLGASESTVYHYSNDIHLGHVNRIICRFLRFLVTVAYFTFRKELSTTHAPRKVAL